MQLPSMVLGATRWLSVVACGVSCHMAYRILVPRPGIELTYPVFEGRIPTTGPPGKSQSMHLM